MSILSIAARTDCRPVSIKITAAYCYIKLKRVCLTSAIINESLQGCIVFVRNMPGMLQQTVTCSHAPEHMPELACCLVSNVVQAFVSLTAYTICKRYLSDAAHNTAMWCKHYISIVGNDYKRVEVPQSESRRRTRPYVRSRLQHCSALGQSIIVSSFVVVSKLAAILTALLNWSFSSLVCSTGQHKLASRK